MATKSVTKNNYLSFVPRVREPIKHELLKERSLKMNIDVKQGFEKLTPRPSKRRNLFTRKSLSLWQVIALILIARLLWYIIVHIHIRFSWS